MFHTLNWIFRLLSQKVYLSAGVSKKDLMCDVKSNPSVTIMKNIFVILLLVLSFNDTNAQNPNHPSLKHQIDSKTLNESNEIWIGLPYNYDSTTNYPVIYLLDAEDHFDITYALTNELAKNDKMPSHILVGIPKKDNLIRFKNFTFSTSNPLDYDTLINPDFFNNPDHFGGGYKYLEYIENEVISFVDKQYKTNGYNILIGHSLTGYFGAYAMPFQKSFSAFQLYDPSVFCNSNEAIKNLGNLKPNYATNVYVTSAAAKKEGDPKGKKVALDAIDAYIQKLTQYPSIRLGTKFYPEEGHLSMYMYSVIDGFSFLYKGFGFGYILPTMNISLENYTAHYKKLSKTTGFDFSPPIDGIRWVAYANYHQKKWDEAIKCYLRCEPYFTDDYQVNLEMAECYFYLNHLKKSLEYYKKCKHLDPKNNSINSKIDELESKLKS